MRKVWFDEERPHKREARLQHEAELERMEARQREEAQRAVERAKVDRARQQVREGEERQERARLYTSARRRERAFADSYRVAADMIPVSEELGEYIEQETISSVSIGDMVPRHRIVQPAYWILRDPPPNFAYVLLRNGPSVGKNSNREDVARVDIIMPEVMKGRPSLGRTYGDHHQVMTRNLPLRAIRLVPMEISHRLFSYLPDELARWTLGLAIVYAPEPITDLRPFIVDHEYVRMFINAPTVEWPGASRSFGLRKYFGYGEYELRGYGG